MATLTTAFLLATIASMTSSIFVVALGLGLVIFFHELGHFAVAKWCNVYVERFSIGFGPILLSKKWGETEYALSLIPFGGYVKMLGQDDADPAEMTDSEIEEDPRSYIAKNVPQRMAIISAGVIMNVITGMMFFALAFKGGVDVPPSQLGTIITGKPAWKAGLRGGDTLTKINGREISTFGDIIRSTALTSSKALDIEGIRADGKTFSTKVYPVMTSTRREIGVGPISGLQLASEEELDGSKVTVTGSPAANASPGFAPSDKILAINSKKLNNFADLQISLARLRAEEVTFTVERSNGKNETKKVDIKVGPQTFRTLGLWMDIGQIEAIQDNSPAAKAGMKTGDKIVRIEELDVGKNLNPLTLPEFFADRHGQSVKVVVTREQSGSDAQELEFTLTPTDRPGWIEKPVMKNSPLSVPAIGVAFHIIPTVIKIEEGSEAEGKISVGDQIEKIQFVLPKGAEPDFYSEHEDKMTLTLDEKTRDWASAFWIMQSVTKRNVKLTLKGSEEDKQPRVVELTPKRTENWYLPTRGIQVTLLSIEQKADTFAEAYQMGFAYAKNSMTDIYLTLRNLVTGNLSVKELHGPIGIAQVAYKVSKQGLADLSLFLGFLSINLAVLNFLPIPLLDGGHMIFLIWEGITRRKPNEKVLIVATYIGMIFVLSLMVLVIFLDVFVHGFFN